MVCAIRNLKMSTKITLNGFQRITDTDTANAAVRRKEGEEGEKDDSERVEQSSESISHGMALH